MSVIFAANTGHGTEILLTLFVMFVAAKLIAHSGYECGRKCDGSAGTQRIARRFLRRALRRERGKQSS